MHPNKHDEPNPGTQHDVSKARQTAMPLRPRDRNYIRKNQDPCAHFSWHVQP